MTKVILLPFVLALMGLVIVMVFLPTSRKVKTVTAEVVQQTSAFPKWVMGMYIILIAIPPIIYHLFPSESSFWNVVMGMYYFWYFTLITALIVLALLWYVGLQLFAAGVPLAQTLGKDMTPNQRRATWRRAQRVYQKFRAS